MTKRAIIDTSNELFQQGEYLKALENLLPLLYGAPVLFEADKLRAEIYEALTQQIKTAKHAPKTMMRFGTSGWRGKLGEDFTCQNIAVVTEALCRVLLGKTDIVGAEEIEMIMGMTQQQMKEQGVILGHDARYFGKEFAAVAISILERHGFKTIYIGQTSTPEISTAILQLKTAFSLNFTPSHNPWMYHGYKFNPPDAGPAGKEFTGPIEQEANRIFNNLASFDVPYSEHMPGDQNTQDPIELYLNHLHTEGAHLIDLDHLKKKINHSQDFALVFDNVFGSAIGKFERLLEGIPKEDFEVLNAEQEAFFKGKPVEPTPKYVENLQKDIKNGILCNETVENAAHLQIVVNDGDADRIMIGGKEAIMSMNRLGPMLYQYLIEKGAEIKDATRSVMTSHRLDKAVEVLSGGTGKLNETKVGFGDVGKSPGLIKMEESDGISFDRWLIDKDGLLPALICADMILSKGKSLEELSDEQDKLLGRFVFEKSKVKLDESLSHAQLVSKIKKLCAGYNVGGNFDTPFGKCAITAKKDIDGYKFWLDNGMWIGFRLSGTEPVARIYAEKEGLYETPEADLEKDVNTLLDWGGQFLNENL